MACFPIGSPIAYLHRDHDRAGWPDFGPLHLSELVSKGYHVKMVVDSLGGVLEGCQVRFALGGELGRYGRYEKGRPQLIGCRVPMQRSTR